MVQCRIQTTGVYSIEVEIALNRADGNQAAPRAWRDQVMRGEARRRVTPARTTSCASTIQCGGARRGARDPALTISVREEEGGGSAVLCFVNPMVTRPLRLQNASHVVSGAMSDSSAPDRCQKWTRGLVCKHRLN